MDNQLQIEMILKYRKHLCAVTQLDLDFNTVAAIWIKRHAEEWRLEHSLSSK